MYYIALTIQYAYAILYHNYDDLVNIFEIIGHRILWFEVTSYWAFRLYNQNDFKCFILVLEFSFRGTPVVTVIARVLSTIITL